MTDTQYAVVGMGNAIVDVITHVDDAFVEAHRLERGAMRLIDADEVRTLYAAMPPGIESSGGSAANTIAGIADLGGKVAYIGKVRDDQLGEVFAHDMRAVGVDYDVPLAAEGDPTARCLIVVTPDAQRTLNTYLGISRYLAPEDVDEALVASADILYCEGYLWDVEVAKAAIRHGMDVAHAAGRRTALALSDSFCVDRHRAEFRELVDGKVDILFANELEICSLYEVDSFDAALQRVRGACDIACLTRSEKGSVIVAGDEVHVVDAHAVDHVVDTTGAGDMYAAGFLWGLSEGHDLATCGRLGSMAAAEVISHLGARPEVSLRELATPIVS
ncbi:adenosine kinase [Actinomarinicola tropica]|uniref:Adenosine kinase n=1 Tax=Actinomarinicola tropica TaxID=2789776 RepID=A0A5Q2RQA7_9ACTN|nr:adenosine kinase [Actinomarinicola tropica]QGG96080.1 adenosine kinase [Actinomarinicola tropica]